MSEEEKIEPINTEIAEYTETAAALAELRHRYAGTVWHVGTPAGDKAARAARLELVTLRTSLDKVRKQLNEDDQGRIKRRNEEAKRITGIIVDLETPIDAQIKAEEARKEAERAAKAEVERQRVAQIRGWIAGLNSYPARFVGKPAAEILSGRVKLEDLDILDEQYEEFQAEAEAAKADALSALSTLYDAAQAAEAQAAEVERKRIELEAEWKRMAEEQRAAEEAAQAEREQIRKEEEARERKARELREAAEAELKERQAKLKAEEDAQRQAAREAEAERKRLASEQAAAIEETKKQAAMEAALARSKAEQEEQEARERLSRLMQEEEALKAKLAAEAKQAREVEQAPPPAEPAKPVVFKVTTDPVPGMNDDDPMFSEVEADPIFDVLRALYLAVCAVIGEFDEQEHPPTADTPIWLSFCLNAKRVADESGIFTTIEKTSP